MRKLKVYLDTSVISHLLQEDVPEKMADTRQLWEMFKAGKYEVYLSTVTLEEIAECPEPKRSELRKLLQQIHFVTLDISDDNASITITPSVIFHPQSLSETPSHAHYNNYVFLMMSYLLSVHSCILLICECLRL